MLDLLSNGFDITAPVRAHLGPTDTSPRMRMQRLLGPSLTPVPASVLPAQRQHQLILPGGSSPVSHTEI
jgi:hypothetical protein